MNLQEFYLTRIISFIKSESPEIYKLFKPSELRDRIRKHLEYNTIVVIWDKSDIACACIFNIDGEICSVHHAIVGSKYERKGLLKRMVREGYLRYPYVRFIKFDRELKYRDRPERLIPIVKFLQGE